MYSGLLETHWNVGFLLGICRKWRKKQSANNTHEEKDKQSHIR